MRLAKVRLADGSTQIGMWEKDHLRLLDLLQVEPLTVAAGEPLRMQAEDFVSAIRSGRRPFVNAEDGFAAVRTAERIVAAAREAGARML